MRCLGERTACHVAAPTFVPTFRPVCAGLQPLQAPGTMGRCLRWLDRFADKMRARGLGSLFHYKTEKFIKVDVPQVEVLFRVSQALCLFVAMFAPLYFNDAWALTETPGGTINAWESPGTMEADASDQSLAGRSPHCSNAAYSYIEGNQQMASPECLGLLPGELTQKTSSSVFFTTAYMEVVTTAWPCVDDLPVGDASSGDAMSGNDTSSGFDSSSGDAAAPGDPRERRKSAASGVVARMMGLDGEAGSSVGDCP